MKLTTVAEQWEGFWAAVRKPGMSDVQRIEMRRSFYAGVFSTIVEFRSIGTDEVSETDGVRHMEALWQECQAFQNAMLRGEA